MHANKCDNIETKKRFLSNWTTKCLDIAVQVYLLRSLTESQLVLGFVAFK